MKISNITSLLTLVMFIFYVFTIQSLGGVNAVTLPWIAIMTVALAVTIIFTLFGRYIMPTIMAKLGFKIYIGDMVIYKRYAIIKDFDQESGPPVAGFSVIKLIPSAPTVDMKEDDKRLLVKSVESFLLSIPTDTEFGILKIHEPILKKMIQRIRAEIKKVEAKAERAKSAIGYQRKLSALQEELERLQRSNPVSAIMFIKVIAKGMSEDDVKAELDKRITQIVSIAEHQLKCTTKVLEYLDLYDFIESELLGKVVRIVGGRGA